MPRSERSPGPWVEEDGAARGREVNAPAFLVNAYDLSNYRFDLFATDRLRADSRLTRPLRLESPASIGAYWRGGTRRADLFLLPDDRMASTVCASGCGTPGSGGRRTQDRKERMIFTPVPVRTTASPRRLTSDA